MLGGAHAASYEIIATELPPGAPCQEPDHALALALALTLTLTLTLALTSNPNL